MPTEPGKLPSWRESSSARGRNERSTYHQRVAIDDPGHALKGGLCSQRSGGRMCDADRQQQRRCSLRGPLQQARAILRQSTAFRWPVMALCFQTVDLAHGDGSACEPAALLPPLDRWPYCAIETSRTSNSILCLPLIVGPADCTPAAHACGGRDDMSTTAIEQAASRPGRACQAKLPSIGEL